MSTTTTGRQSPPSGISINLASNNPFRNRNTLMPSPLSSPDPRVSRFPMAHNNPFLDASEVANTSSRPAPAPAAIGVAKSANIAVPDDIFSDLSLLDKPKKSTTLPVSGHRTHISEDRRGQSRGPPVKPGSPGKPTQRHQRRASESSVMEKERRPREERDRSDRPPRTESEERRRRERRREREERHRKEKEAGGRSTRSKRPQGLDIIDKLDVTGVYGQGLFHHDGPFDACNPHRNSKKDRRAPMQAFPADSANMRLGGFGPVSDRIDLDRFHGRGAEGFNDFSTTLRRGPATTVIDPTARTEPVHGEETHGLGTSTFLEGAPASKAAVQQQRRDSGDFGDGVSGSTGNAGGLGRKKSLAQRFRGMSGTRPQYRPSVIDQSSPPLPNDAKSLSAGGVSRTRHANKEDEVNPFFETDKADGPADYDSAFEKKGTQIRIAEKALQPPSSSTERPKTSSGRSYSHNNSDSTSHKNTSSHARASSNPRGGQPPRAAPPPPPNQLVRTLTDEQRASGSSSEMERSGSGSGGGGFLKRMRSLKGRS